jgi:hypothetical protein
MKADCNMFKIAVCSLYVDINKLHEPEYLIRSWYYLIWSINSIPFMELKESPPQEPFEEPRLE